MKGLSIGLLFMAASLVSVSCDDNTDNLLLEQDEAIVLNEAQLEKLQYCGSYEDDFAGEKIETIASDEYIDVVRKQIEARLASNQGGNKVATSNMWVGVIKEKTCGKYDEIHIHYDTEDDNTQTSILGYAKETAWKYDRNGNIEMYFCVVPSDLFKPIGKHYALLSLTNKVDIVVDEDKYGEKIKAEALVLKILLRLTKISYFTFLNMILCNEIHL